MRIPSIGHSAKQKSWDFFVGDLTADLTKAIELGQLLPFPFEQNSEQCMQALHL